jgi:signal transduction histidine kinase
VIAKLGLDRRVALAAQALGYLAVSVPLALGAIVAVLALMVGAALSVIAIGLPILLPAAALCRWLVALDRRAANRFLDAHIAPLPGPERTEGGPWRRTLQILSDRLLWRRVATLALKPPLVAGGLIVALVPVLVLAELLILGVQAIAGLGDIDYFGPWTFGPGVGVVLLALALPAAVLAVATLDALRAVQFAIARAILGPRASDQAAPVRELLAESLGDRSVAIAYWLPDRRQFVDEVGRPVELPDPGSGRAWTAIEREGRPVAAIIHDAALETSDELVAAAAAASSLAIDNERLKADLRARVEELRVSRLRIVQATDEARRRIERDLHDGAQQQLVSLALELRVLRSRVDDPQLREAVDALAERLGVAVGELRELARGIHPSILTEQGIGPAVAALAERSSVPIEVDVGIEQRMPAAVESAAYFTVAEALTNVAKYAHASGARVGVRRNGDEVLVEVADDGVGGVDLDAGSGLRGLRDRLSAVDGTLAVDSPPGGGTRLRARIPCTEWVQAPAPPASAPAPAPSAREARA